MKSAIVWLRRDLRTSDHTVFKLATESADRVAVVFVFDTNILKDLPDRDDTRVSFIYDSLQEVGKKLKEHGSRLILLHGDPRQLIPSLAKELEVQTVFTSHDDDPYAISRDADVGITLARHGIEVVTAKDHVVFERQEILNGTGQPFKVFTPYRNIWRSRLEQSDLTEQVPDLSKLWQRPPLQSEVDSLSDIGFDYKAPWTPAGEREAHKRLKEFAAHISDYTTKRNFPAINGTSHLSVHLRHGTISIRECVREALRHRSNGAAKWLDELVWREFYHMILANFPQVVTEPFRPEFLDVKWPGDPSHYDAWEKGMTGYPLVDAAMRCLNETGWMHNRLRMIVAMFLTKDLLLDYKLGEAHLARMLLDFELASTTEGGNGLPRPE